MFFKLRGADAITVVSSSMLEWITTLCKVIDDYTPNIFFMMIEMIVVIPQLALRAPTAAPTMGMGIKA